MHSGFSRWKFEEIVDFIPVLAAKACFGMRFAEENGFGPQILCELHIGSSITNYKGLAKVIVFRKIGSEHACSGLSRRCLLVLEAAVDVDGRKVHIFLFQGLQHFVLGWPEVLFWKRIGSQSILVAHQHQFVVTFFRDFAEVGDGFGDKLEFLQTINLKICRWLFDEGAISIYK